MKVVLAGLAVVILWASAFAAIRIAAPALGVIGLSAVRLIVAAVSLLAVSRFTRIRMPARRDYPLILTAAFFGMASYQVLLNWGELYVPAGTSSIIVAAAPLVSIAIAAGFFGERLTVLKILGSAVAIAGVVMVSVARSGLTVSGAVWIVIAAAVAQGIYHPLTKPLLARYSGLEVATYGIVAGAAMLLPSIPFGWSAMASASGAAWVAAVYLGVLPSAIGFVLWGYAVARLPMATATSLLYLVPPVAVFIAWAALGEVPFVAELGGGLVVVAGVVTVGFGDRLRVVVAQSRGRRLIADADPT